MGPAAVEEREACLEWLLSACRLWLLKTGQERLDQESVQANAKLESGTTGDKKGPVQASGNYPFGQASGKPALARAEPASELTLPSAAPLNQDVLQRMAYVQGLEPILHDLVRRDLLHKSDLPPHLISEWERSYFNNVIRNTSLLDVFAEILSACEKHNIPLIGLKGLAATAALYKDPGLRVMADIDLLCRPSDLPALRGIVLSAGFLERPSLQAHHLTFYHRELGFPIEFHFSLQFIVKNRKHLLFLLWNRSQTSTIDELRLSILSPEDRLIFDLAHILDHVYVVPLKNYLDLMAGFLLFDSELDWDYLEAALRQSELTEEFGILCMSLSGLFRIPLPIPIRPDQSQNYLREVKSTIQTHLLSMGFDKLPSSATRLKSYAGVFQKAAFTLSYLFPPLSVIQAAYGKHSLFSSALHYPLHLLASVRDFRKRKKRDAPAQF